MAAVKPAPARSLARLESLEVVPALKGRRTTGGYVAESLRAAIQSGALPEGAELSQVALAEHFGVSRVPVREALSALEAEGWISTRANYRAIVQAVGADRVEQIFEVRALLEGELVARAVRHASAAQLDALADLCDRMDRLKDHGEWVAANRRFHRELLASPGSELMLELIEQVSGQVERYLRLRGASPMRERQAGAEHRAILAAVRARDVRRARSLVREHIDHTRQLVLAAIAQPQSVRTAKGK